MTTSLLVIGFAMGIRHALEADHLASMATLAARNDDFRSTALQGAAWGAGHTLTLLLFAGIALIVGRDIPDGYAHLLEGLVGVMLVGLGLDVLRRLMRGGADLPVATAEAVLPRRALMIGLMHGLAGSAALVVLAGGATQGGWSGVSYVLLFGLGSILGMVLLSVVMMVSLRRVRERGPGIVWQGVQAILGVATLLLGLYLVWGRWLAG